MFKFIFSEYKGFALGMQSLRLDAKQRTRKCCQTAFECRKISISFYRPSAMKEQK